MVSMNPSNDDEIELIEVQILVTVIEVLNDESENIWAVGLVRMTVIVVVVGGMSDSSCSM